MSWIVFADLLLLALIGVGAIWAYKRWPGDRPYGNGRLPADHDFLTDTNRPGDADTSRGSAQGG